MIFFIMLKEIDRIGTDRTDVLDRTAAERCETGTEDHARIQQVRISHHALVQAGHRLVQQRQDRSCTRPGPSLCPVHRSRRGKRGVEVLIGPRRTALALAKVTAHDPCIEVVGIHLQCRISTVLSVGELIDRLLEDCPYGPVREGTFRPRRCSTGRR